MNRKIEQPKARALDFTVLGRRIIIGYNAEKTLRYGKKRESGFTAYGFWPLLIGIGRPRR